MIVVDDGSRLRLITQCDHAHLAAEILSLLPALVDEPLRDVLLRATRRHDDGWQGIDAAPPVDDQGRPYDFIRLPWELRTEIWDRGTSLAGIQPETALLIAEHAVELHRESSSKEDLAKSLLELLETRRAELRERLGASAEGVSALYPWLKTADLLSLIVVNRWTGRTFELDLPDRRAHEPGRARLEEKTLRLQPFPLAGATTLHYPERTIENRSYRDTVDLGTTLARAPWRSDTVTIRSWS
ncbi:MAG TPA: DUF3891 family protein [Thermoanaerobaculia bacterium]|nr:DUF3891 family protein [Thermoanaerobaculia bacterium]